MNKLLITPLMEQQMFDDWCPYSGNPDPRTVWSAAIEAVNGLHLTVSQPKEPEQSLQVTDEENEQFSRDVSNFKGADPEATKYALETFLRNRALAQPEHEPVAWRPAFDYDGYDLEGTWNNGKPTEKDLEFWGNTKVGIEYAYKIKGNI